MSARRVLLTGASGFVGRHAIAPLMARGFEVHAAVRRTLPAPGVVMHTVDLLDSAAVTRLIASVRPSHLLHAAWDVTPGRFWRAPENLDWIAASLALYRAFAAHGGRRMVGVGSCTEYEPSAAPLDEATSTLRPVSLYGVAKHGLHGILAAAADIDGVSLAWGRVFFLYGPHEAASRLVPSVIAPLLRGDVALVGHGRAERDFMHVADAAAALVSVLDNGWSGPINIATGVCRPIRELVLALAAEIGRPDLVRFGAGTFSPDEPPRLAAVVHGLHEIGFRPQHNWATGLADTVAWWARVLERETAEYSSVMSD